MPRNGMMGCGRELGRVLLSESGCRIDTPEGLRRRTTKEIEQGADGENEVERRQTWTWSTRSDGIVVIIPGSRRTVTGKSNVSCGSFSASSRPLETMVSQSTVH